MIQVLALRDFVDRRTGVQRKREVFFNKGWRLEQVEDVFNEEKLNALLDQVPDAEKYNLYYTVANCYEEEGRKLKEQFVIPFDIDGIYIEEGNEIASATKVIQAAVDAIGVPFSSAASVFSGNGVQLFIRLKNPIVDPTFFDAARQQYGVLVSKINSKLLELGLEGKADPAVWSRGRLMRLPNTENRKPGKPVRMARIVNPTMVEGDFDLSQMSGVELNTTEVIHDAVLKNYPTPDTKSVLQGCDFLRWCNEDPALVKEPQWYAMVSITARLEKGADLTHEYSAGHPDYNHYETDNKIEQALASAGPRTCKNIESLWSGCKGCANYGKVTSPIMIKGEDYIASKDFGFRKRKIKDGIVTPGPVEHADLVREFESLHPYKVVNDNDQVIVYKSTHWEYMSPRRIKGWVLERVSPEPTAAEMAEFVERLKCRNIVSLEELHQHKDGYMNFSNAVLNVRTLETMPHSPSFGFFQTLPFAYDKYVKAPLFERFLLDICKGNELKAETIKEYMGYCISGDPCWLQKALLLYGTGANGKSVLMETVSALVGKDAYAAVPLQDLEQDTMRYLIANKLFNYSEETSLRALSDSSLFKTLVTGGNITIRQLYAQPYIAENRTKLIISANQLPQTRDTSNGLLRRLAIIKMEAVFNPEVEGHDYFIKDKLMAELPGIYNLLIEAYGRLKERGILAGTEIIKEALQEYREETDTVEYFLKEETEPTNDPESFITSQELYDKYVALCEMSGIKNPLHKIGFGRALASRGFNPKIKKLKGKSIRGFEGLKLQGEEEF